MRERVDGGGVGGRNHRRLLPPRPLLARHSDNDRRRRQPLAENTIIFHACCTISVLHLSRLAHCIPPAICIPSRLLHPPTLADHSPYQYICHKTSPYSITFLYIPIVNFHIYISIYIRYCYDRNEQSTIFIFIYYYIFIRSYIYIYLDKLTIDLPQPPDPARNALLVVS